jgi:transcriptional regulator GlxA family with amidase domain
VNWIPQTRWVVDGNIWSSSSVSAGIGVAYAFIAALYWDGVAGGIANSSDYVRWLDPSYDPFAAVWDVMK